MGNYTTTILKKLPLAYYRLGESSGTSVSDASGNNYTGGIHGGVTLGLPGAIKRDANTSVQFDGSSGYISLPSALTLPTSHFSIEFWMNISSRTALANYPCVVSQDNAQSNLVGFNVGLFPAGTDGTFFNLAVGGVWKQATSSTIFVVGTWYHMVYTFDGTTMVISTNGVQAASLSASGAMSASSNVITIGNLLSGDFYAGMVDEVALYGFALTSSQIAENYSAGTSGTTIVAVQDATIFKSQVVKAYDPSGNFIDTVKDAPYLSGFTEAISAATTALTVSLPRAIDAYDGTNQPNSKQTIVQGNILKWFLYGPGLPSSGLLRYQGIIDTIRPHLDETGAEAVELTVTPYSQVLGDHGIIGPISYGTAGNAATYIDTGTMFASLFTTQIDSTTGHTYGYPLTLDPSNPATTGNTCAALLQNQTLVSALTTFLLLSPSNYYFRPNMSDNTVTFNQYGSTADHVLKIGQHISSMEYALDNVPRKNLIIVQGNGVMATAHGASISTIGQRTYFKNDNRITDTNTAQLLANGLLAFYDRPQIRTKVKIPDYRGDALYGIGYDIEKFKIGQMVKIIDTKAPTAAINNAPSLWGGFRWGTDHWNSAPATLAIWGLFKWGQTDWGFNVGGVFNTLVPIVAINYGFFSCELELGFRQPSMLRSMSLLESKFLDTSMVG